MEFLAEAIGRLRAKERYRALREIEGPAGTRMRVDGREVLVLCSSNYLGLATHPTVCDAARSAIERYGTSSSAARLIAGNSELYRALEGRLARFVGTEAALVYSTGYMANLGVLSALVGEGDIIYADALAHASVVDGTRLSRARVQTFRHGDAAHLRVLMRRGGAFRRRLVVVDGVYSMDGDLAPLQEFIYVAREHEALVMVDDAHGIGVLGARGRGTVEHLSLQGRIDILVGTLGKALGSFGAFVAGSRTLIEYLINTSRSFIFTCALPPGALGAALAAIEVIEREPGLRARLWANVERFRDGLHAMGLSTAPSVTHILPLHTGEPRRTMDLTERLLALGVYCQGIRPPTVPPRTCRLRFTLTAEHTEADVGVALGAVAEAGRELGLL